MNILNRLKKSNTPTQEELEELLNLSEDMEAYNKKLKENCDHINELIVEILNERNSIKRCQVLGITCNYASKIVAMALHYSNQNTNGKLFENLKNTVQEDLDSQHE